MTDQPHCPADGIAGRLDTIYRALREHFGHRDWWPGESPWEICVGAVLTQNTAWTNVEKAIANLKDAGALSIDAMATMPRETLAELIRPSGYYNQKAQRLGDFARWIASDYGSLDALFDRDAAELRALLLARKGVGEETADSMVLYAAEKPVFVVDAYTKRIFARKALVADRASYAEVQALFETYLPRDVALYNDYHAQIVALGHHFCRPKPLCDSCPVRGL